MTGLVFKNINFYVRQIEKALIKYKGNEILMFEEVRKLIEISSFYFYTKHGWLNRNRVIIESHRIIIKSHNFIYTTLGLLKVQYIYIYIIYICVYVIYVCVYGLIAEFHFQNSKYGYLTCFGKKKIVSLSMYFRFLPSIMCPLLSYWTTFSTDLGPRSRPNRVSQ